MPDISRTCPGASLILRVCHCTHSRGHGLPLRRLACCGRRRRRRSDLRISTRSSNCSRLLGLTGICLSGPTLATWQGAAERAALGAGWRWTPDECGRTSEWPAHRQTLIEKRRPADLARGRVSESSPMCAAGAAEIARKSFVHHTARRAGVHDHG